MKGGSSAKAFLVNGGSGRGGLGMTGGKKGWDPADDMCRGYFASSPESVPAKLRGRARGYQHKVSGSKVGFILQSHLCLLLAQKVNN